MPNGIALLISRPGCTEPAREADATGRPAAVPGGGIGVVTFRPLLLVAPIDSDYVPDVALLDGCRVVATVAPRRRTDAM